MNYLIETERLRLREFVPDDAGFIIALLNSPGWLQFIGERDVKTLEQAKNYLKNGPLKSYLENGFGLLLIETKMDGKPIGMCGILKRQGMEHPDIGFALLPEYFGKGYAYEATNSTLFYAKNHLNIPVISAITAEDNIQSIRLLEKLGLKYIRTIRLSGDEEEVLLYNSQ